jgi:hypothetical protein
VTTKVVIYNEGPKNVYVDDGQTIKCIHPGARDSQYVYKGKTLTLFEEGNDEATVSQG